MLVLLFAAFLQSAPPPVRTVGKGALSDIEAPQEVVVRSAADWSRLWRTHGGDGQPPTIDFTREIVVGVFLGTRPTAGYRVEIVRAVGNKDVLVVEYVEATPSPDSVTAQVLTAPYHLAAIPKHGGEVTFRKVPR